MAKKNELSVSRATIALLREAIVKTGYKARFFNFCLKEPLKFSTYSAKDAINLLKVKRGGNRGKD